MLGQGVPGASWGVAYSHTALSSGADWSSHPHSSVAKQWSKLFVYILTYRCGKPAPGLPPPAASSILPCFPISAASGLQASVQSPNPAWPRVVSALEERKEHLFRISTDGPLRLWERIPCRELVPDSRLPARTSCDLMLGLYPFRVSVTFLPVCLSLSLTKKLGVINQWFSKCASRTSSITWEFAANPNSQVAPRPTKSKTLVGGGKQSVLEDSEAHSSLRTSGLVHLAKDS